MVKKHDSPAVEAPGVSVSLDRRMHAASLRYLAGDGSFVRIARASLGVALPDPLCATQGVELGGDPVMAWRSPTETLLICADQGVLGKLETDVAACSDGCVVVQTGGLRVLRASGERVPDLLARLGGQGVLPPLGGARRSRLAEIAVLAIQVQRDETLLVVDRAYAEHLMDWIRVSATDLDIS